MDINTRKIEGVDKSIWEEKLSLHKHLLTTIWLKEKVDHFDKEKELFIKLFEFFSLPDKGRLLEVGCGTGKIRIFLPIGIEYTGIDPLSGKVSVFNCQYGLAEEIPFEKECFDMVLIYDMLGHTYNPIKVMQEVYRVLKLGGRLYFSDEMERDRQDHLFVFEKDTILELLEQQGFKVEKFSYNIRHPLFLDLVAIK